MKTSDSIGQLAAALSAAQGKFTNPERNRDVEVQMKSGGKYTFAYLTFDAGIEMARPCLTENGLAFTQFSENSAEGILVTTKLMHASGEWIESELGWGLGGGEGIQQLGGTLTYLKRYSLFSMLGIAADMDDDGNAATGNQAKFTPRTQGAPAQRPAAEPAKPKPSPEELRKQAVARIRESNSLDDLATVEQRLRDSKTINAVDKTMLQGLIDDQRKYLEGTESAFMGGEGPEPDGEGM